MLPISFFFIIFQYKIIKKQTKAIKKLTFLKRFRRKDSIGSEHVFGILYGMIRQISEKQEKDNKSKTGGNQ
jgi:hypothetical protein